jgi:hypothetical protein
LNIVKSHFDPKAEQEFIGYLVTVFSFSNKHPCVVTQKKHARVGVHPCVHTRYTQGAKNNF